LILKLEPTLDPGSQKRPMKDITLEEITKINDTGETEINYRQKYLESGRGYQGFRISKEDAETLKKFLNEAYP